MEIKILHIFPDRMNLYGEYANISVLERYLKELGHTVTVDTLSLYEEKSVSGYDFYYMGSGTEKNQKLALAQLMKYGPALKAACDEGRVMLFTGNAFELLGTKITDAQGTAYECLGLEPFETTEGTRRMVLDALGTCEQVAEPLVGFINKCSTVKGVAKPFATLSMGYGNEGLKGAEGFRRNNCIGTHLTGPVLVKNPAFLRYVVSLLGEEDPGRIRWEVMEQAYAVTASALTARLNAEKK